MTKFTLTTVVAMLMLSGITTAQNTPTPCACPQWLWATWTDGNGNTFYSYYSQMCDGPDTGDPYWASLDTSAYYGEYPGGSCTNNGGCSNPAVPTLVPNGKSVNTKMSRSVNQIQKNIDPLGNRILGLGSRGIGNAPKHPGPWNRGKGPKISPGAGVIPQGGPVFVYVEVKNPAGNDVIIEAKLFSYALNPANHTPRLPGDAITIGVGIQAKREHGNRPTDTIKWNKVTTISPEPRGGNPASETYCIRFDHHGVQYQVITAEPVRM